MDCPNYAFAGRSMRVTPLITLSMTGQNSSTIASVVIEPTRPFDQNTFMSPPEPIIDSRNASSAVAEHQRQRERRQRNADLLEDVADHAKTQHQPDVEHRVLDRV